MCDVTAGFSVERESVLFYKQEAIASESFESLIWELFSQAIVSCFSSAANSTDQVQLHSNLPERQIAPVSNH